jgi:hypothetical protein
VRTELVEGTTGGLGQRPDHHVRTRSQPGELGAQQMAQTAPDGVTNNRAADGLPDHEPSAGRHTGDDPRSPRGKQVHHQTITPDPTTTPDHGGEVVGSAQSLVWPEHGQPQVVWG